MTPPETLGEKLDQLLGEVREMRGTIGSQTEALGRFSERMAIVEQETKSTKEVVEAWVAAKTWLRWAKWLAGVVASCVAAFAAYKGLAK